MNGKGNAGRTLGVVVSGRDVVDDGATDVLEAEEVLLVEISDDGEVVDDDMVVDVVRAVELVVIELCAVDTGVVDVIEPLELGMKGGR